MSYFTAHLSRRGSQVVRQGSAKALCVGSIPTLASKFRRFVTKILGGIAARLSARTFRRIVTPGEPWNNDRGEVGLRFIAVRHIRSNELGPTRQPRV